MVVPGDFLQQQTQKFESGTMVVPGYFLQQQALKLESVTMVVPEAFPQQQTLKSETYKPHPVLLCLAPHFSAEDEDSSNTISFLTSRSFTCVCLYCCVVRCCVLRLPLLKPCIYFHSYVCFCHYYAAALNWVCAHPEVLSGHLQTHPPEKLWQVS